MNDPDESTPASDPESARAGPGVTPESGPPTDEPAADAGHPPTDEPAIDAGFSPFSPPPGYHPGYPDPGLPAGYPQPGYPIPGYGPPLEDGTTAPRRPMLAFRAALKGLDRQPNPPPRPTEEWMGFDPLQSAPRWGMGDIWLGLLAWVIVQIAVVIPVVIVTNDKIFLGIMSLLGGWLGMVGYLVFISKRKGCGSLWADFGWDFKWLDMAIGLGVAFATLIVSGIVRIVIAGLFNEEPGSNAANIFGDAENNHVALVIMAIMASIGAPIVEELFFRGLTLRAIERRGGAIIAIIGSSMVFGLLHWQPGSFGSTVSLVSGILIYGLFFALVTRWSGRLGPSTFAHMAINTLASSGLLYDVFAGNGISG